MSRMNGKKTQHTQYYCSGVNVERVRGPTVSLGAVGPREFDLLHLQHMPFTSLCDLPLLFVYFQVNNGVLYFLDYEDIYIMALSVLVSM